MTDFRFSKAVLDEHLVLSGRYCCLCEEHQGARVEIHHVIPKSEGGTRDFENAVVLCFKCHADVHAYATKSPKGRKYGPSELRRRRDWWYEKFKQRIPEVDHEKLAGEVLRQFGGHVLPQPDSPPIDTEELARQATARTVQLLHAAINLQSQHKEREAIELLLTAYDMDMPAEAKVELHILVANCFQHMSELEEAEGHYNQALSISRRSELKSGEAAALGDLGVIYGQRGDLPRGEQYLIQSLALHRELNSKDGEARALGNLGIIYRDRGDLNQAEQCQMQALAICRTIGERTGEACALGNLGVIHRERGDLEAAEKYHRDGLNIHRDLGNRGGEASALGNLGHIYRHNGDIENAERHYAEALAIGKDIGHRIGEMTAQASLASLYRMQGNLERAQQFYEVALATSPRNWESLKRG